MLNKIHKILEENGGSCIIIENGQIKSVLLSFEQYEKIIGRTKANNESGADVNNSVDNRIIADQNKSKLGMGQTQTVNDNKENEEMSFLAEDEIIKKMKEKIEKWQKEETPETQLTDDSGDENKSIDNKENQNKDEISEEDKTKGVSLEDLPIE